jgi:hydrogenase maturation factor
LEKGLPIETHFQVVQPMIKAANETEVNIITGDTKMVNKSKGDGVYINTSGIGVITHSLVVPEKPCFPEKTVKKIGVFIQQSVENGF